MNEGFDRAGQKIIGLIAKPHPNAILYEIASVFVDPRDWQRLDLPDRLFYLYFLAWLTIGGECVIGGGEVETYVALPPFDVIGSQSG